ncbi:transporter substrate-binding domain-containing protein [uncultured Amphritea sp.]|uniref:transporter substrate-binding domain-containing protein n=1 Tax=uncultured Amphritea sp. TaxID=981605 RepID=UPI002619A9CE|nr:transporter substrate-binding domain-containing protein [uncultured Amphritea sp.]
MAGENQVKLYTVEFPPYTIIGPQNAISGIDVEVVKAAFAAVGIEATISEAPWKRIVKNMEHGKIAGTLSCAKNPTREAFMLFSDPTSENNRVAITAKDFDTRKLIKFADLHHYQVISVTEWGVEQQLTQHDVNHSTTPDVDSGIRSVVYRNVDVFYSGELTTLYHARELGLQNKIKSHRLNDIKSTPLHLCLSKQYPGNEALLDQFNAGLNKIKTSGEFDAIYKQYF